MLSGTGGRPFQLCQWSATVRPPAFSLLQRGGSRAVHAGCIGTRWRHRTTNQIFLDQSSLDRIDRDSTAGARLTSQAKRHRSEWKRDVLVVTHEPCTRNPSDRPSDLLIFRYIVWVKKIPPEVFWHLFPNGCEFLHQILHTHYMFLSTLEYIFYLIISNCDEVMPYWVRPPSVRFNRL